MNSEINEIIVRNKQAREPMSFERFKFLCWFIAGVIGEILGFALALVIALCMSGVLR